MVSDESHLYKSTIALEKFEVVMYLLIQVTKAPARSCRLYTWERSFLIRVMTEMTHFNSTRDN